MERIGHDQIADLIEKHFMLAVILGENGWSRNRSFGRGLWENGRDLLYELGFLDVSRSFQESRPQPGDIVGYADTRLPYSPISREFNQRQYLQRRPPYFRHFGVIDHDGQVISRRADTGELCKHDTDDKEVKGEGAEETVVYLFRQSPPQRATRRRKTTA